VGVGGRRGGWGVGWWAGGAEGWIEKKR